MAVISVFRDKFGLNQQELADFLGVSRSLVTRYEMGTRNFPSDANSKYNLLSITMGKIEIDTLKADYTRKPHAESTRRIEHVKSEWEYQATASAYKLERMKEKLLAVQKQYFQTRDLMDLIDKMLETVSQEKDEGSFLWLMAQYVHAKKRLLKCDEATQLQLRMKIAILEATAKVMNSEF